MTEKSNFITGSLVRETYDSNKLIDRKIISECILNIEAWRELALQEKDLGIESNISMGLKEIEKAIIKSIQSNVFASWSIICLDWVFSRQNETIYQKQ